MASTYKASGRCLCGGVKYEITARPSQVVNCHCIMCRQAIGCTFATYCAILYPDHFKLLKKSTLKEYRSSTTLRRMFCGTCGSSLFMQSDNGKDTIWISPGTLIGDPDISVDCNVFVKYKAPWHCIDDGLPASDEGELYEDNAAKVSKP